jgi:hypothetical protein
MKRVKIPILGLLEHVLSGKLHSFKAFLLSVQNLALKHQSIRIHVGVRTSIMINLLDILYFDDFRGLFYLLLLAWVYLSFSLDV